MLAGMGASSDVFRIVSMLHDIRIKLLMYFLLQYIHVPCSLHIVFAIIEDSVSFSLAFVVDLLHYRILALDEIRRFRRCVS